MPRCTFFNKYFKRIIKLRFVQIIKLHKNLIMSQKYLIFAFNKRQPFSFLLVRFVFNMLRKVRNKFKLIS